MTNFSTSTSSTAVDITPAPSIPIPTLNKNNNNNNNNEYRNSLNNNSFNNNNTSFSNSLNNNSFNNNSFNSQNNSFNNNNNSILKSNNNDANLFSSSFSSSSPENIFQQSNVNSNSQFFKDINHETLNNNTTNEQVTTNTIIENIKNTFSNISNKITTEPSSTHHHNSANNDNASTMIKLNNRSIEPSRLAQEAENEKLFSNSFTASPSSIEEVSVKQRFQFLYNWIIGTIRHSTIHTWLRLSVFAIIIVCICLAIFVFKVQNHLDILQKFVDKFGIFLGGLVFMGVFVLLIVFLIPVTIPTIIAGIIFKLWFGILFVWAASVIGGTVSFILGRYVFRKSIAKMIEKNKKLNAVDSAIGQEGWKIVLLLRLTPIIPESLLNYALSVTKIQFIHYFVCSAIGLIPGVSFFTYVGSMIGNISEIGQKRHVQKGEIAMYVISAFAMVFTILFITIIVRRAVNKKLELEEKRGLLDEEEKLSGDNFDESESLIN
ncbi:hypothetical protein CYY_008071 [Polysphondylium violaceum]|uniref:VTT domain-containing protein n=1 Tax=Polysphondylium violaceum TaxID=133409 RepID=A0A8J4PNQ5_9MYCE|nr:hypothetical protein CYY_008071 [Polysphondylium violaceum]